VGGHVEHALLDLGIAGDLYELPILSGHLAKKIFASRFAVSALVRLASASRHAKLRWRRSLRAVPRSIKLDLDFNDATLEAPASSLCSMRARRTVWGEVTMETQPRTANRSDPRNLDFEALHCLTRLSRPIRARDLSGSPQYLTNVGEAARFIASNFSVERARDVDWKSSCSS
jgi:hypothetical protein